MTIGGLGNYNENLNGFVINNAPTSNELAGWMDVVKHTSAGYQRDYIDALFHFFGASGAYGSNWESVSLPDSPALGRSVLRINTDDSNRMRLYSYNSLLSLWQPSQYGEKSMTTTVQAITSTGTGTAIDYTGTEARAKHTLQIVGLNGTGTFNSATVHLEISLDGTNFFSVMNKTLTGTGNDGDKIEINAVKIRYNVTAISVSGDATLEVTITSV